MKANLILNGEIDLSLCQNKLINQDNIYVVDGAYNAIADLPLTINAILGDLDSITNIPKNVKTIKLADQDYTDFEKSINFLQQYYKDFSVYGASGSAVDHFLGNLHVAKKYCRHNKIIFYDKQQVYEIIHQKTIIQHAKDNIISLIPLHHAKGVTTNGMQYELYNQDLLFGSNPSLRNKAIQNEVTIDIIQGELLMVRHQE